MALLQGSPAFGVPTSPAYISWIYSERNSKAKDISFSIFKFRCEWCIFAIKTIKCKCLKIVFLVFLCFSRFKTLLDGSLCLPWGSLLWISRGGAGASL